MGVPSDPIPARPLGQLDNASSDFASPLSRNAFMFSNCLLGVATLTPILPALKEEFAGRVPSRQKRKHRPKAALSAYMSVLETTSRPICL